MLTENDKAIYFYYGAAMNEGEIIDAGCLIGGTTQALADSLKLSGNSNKIRVFDLFKTEPYIKNFLNMIYGASPELGENFRPYFDDNLKEKKGVIEVYDGDITVTAYKPDKYISLLGLDCCKTLVVNDFVIRYFFPQLLPNKSVLIQQDFIHPWLPWVQISMDLLSDYFEPELDGVEYSFVFRCIKPITMAEINKIFGPESDLDKIPDWYGRKDRNVEILKKLEKKMLYPIGKAAIANIVPFYLKQLGHDSEAREEFHRIHNKYPDYPVPPDKRDYILG